MAFDNPSYFQFKENENRLSKKTNEKKFFFKHSTTSANKLMLPSAAAMATPTKSSEIGFASGRPRPNDLEPKYRPATIGKSSSEIFTGGQSAVAAAAATTTTTATASTAGSAWTSLIGSRNQNHHKFNSLRRFAQPLDSNFQQLLGQTFDQNNNRLARTNSTKVLATAASSEDIVPPSVVLNRKICTHCTPNNSLARNHNNNDFEMVNLNTKVENFTKCDLYKITIVYCEKRSTVLSWVNYFQKVFTEFEKTFTQTKFKFNLLKIEDRKNNNAKTNESNLQIIIFCPKLLESIGNSENGAYLWPSELKAENFVGIFLGVSESLSMSISNLPQTLKKFFVDRDKDEIFVRIIVDEFRELLEKHQQRKTLPAFDVELPMNNSVIRNVSFSISPKKVKPSSNIVMILLSEPLKKDDRFEILIERNQHLYAIGHVQRKNPYTLKFIMPDACFNVSSIVSVMLVINGRLVACKKQLKCECKLKELESLLKNDDKPMEFMCKALGLSKSTRHELDHWLTDNFVRNVPKNFSLLNDNEQLTDFLEARTVQPQQQALNSISNEEYPTLLHFAARFGLENLCLQLIECPGGEHACQLTNTCGLTPIEIATNAGFNHLAQYLKNFLEINEFNKVLSLLKNINHDETNAGSTNAMSDVYLVPPPARPIEPEKIPFTNGIDRNDLNYMNLSSGCNLMKSLSDSSFLKNDTKSRREPQMDNETRVTTGTTMSLSVADEIAIDSFDSAARNIKMSRLSMAEQLSSPTSPTSIIQDDELIPMPEKNGTMLQQQQQQPQLSSSYNQVAIDRYQNELIEILNDYKNDIFSIGEVEKLFDNWKNRNEVKQSFLEKQQQLNLMRLEYDRVQQLMKAASDPKKPNIFDKLKNLLFQKQRRATTTPSPLSPPSPPSPPSPATGSVKSATATLIRNSPTTSSSSLTSVTTIGLQTRNSFNNVAELQAKTYRPLSNISTVTNSSLQSSSSNSSTTASISSCDTGTNNYLIRNNSDGNVMTHTENQKTAMNDNQMPQQQEKEFRLLLSNTEYPFSC